MIPLFKSHYSIGKSILTLNPPKDQDDGSSDSIFEIALNNNLQEVVLVEDSLIGFFQAYKICKGLNLKFIFGLRLSMRNSEEEKDINSDHKIIVFAKNNEGCKLLNKIYSKAFAFYDGYLTYEALAKLWDNESLKLAIPFYDSFIHNNNFSFGNSVPNFSFTVPTFFIESNSLAFDALLEKMVLEFAQKANNYPVEKVKSIFYKNKKDVEALMTYKIICNRSFGKNRTMSRPELNHFCSDEFSFESWKEKNAEI